MACSNSASKVIEQIYGLPEGTIAKLGGEGAAWLAMEKARNPDDPFVRNVVAELTRKDESHG